MKRFLPYIIISLLILYPEFRAHSEGKKASLPADSLHTQTTLIASDTNGLLSPPATAVVVGQEYQQIHDLKERYRKSIDVLKLLYEKILGLDHHFTSMKTHQNIQKLSNPHSYPDFKKVNALMKEKLKDRHNLQMPPLLETNPYIASAFSLVTAIVGSGKKEKREKEFTQISCILDFTLRMNTDLKVIYFETEYLKDANLVLKKECEALFQSAISPLGYHWPLTRCRQSDDWEKVYDLLEQYAEQSEAEYKKGGANAAVLAKREIELKFAIHGVVDFINKYNTFVSQGNRYYSKFDRILTTYEFDTNCIKDLPKNFSQLKKEISETSQKFNTAYELSEIKGSKLKELLFGGS
ncbi:MAG: hypothetical protein AAFV95_03480 [Bacteroidota bacterium]